MRTISVRLDDATDTLLSAYCRRHGLTQTEAVKAAIEQLAQRHKPRPAELAAKFGLIGAYDSGDPDLGARHADRIKTVLQRKARQDSVPAGARPARRKTAAA